MKAIVFTVALSFAFIALGTFIGVFYHNTFSTMDCTCIYE